MRASLAEMPAPARRAEKNAGKKRKRSKGSGSDRDRGPGGDKRNYPKNRFVKQLRGPVEELKRGEKSEGEEEDDDYKMARRRERKIKAHKKRPRLTITASGSQFSSSGVSETGRSLSNGKSSAGRKRAHGDEDDSIDSGDDDSSSDSSGSSSSSESSGSSSSSSDGGGQDMSSSSSGESSDEEKEDKKEDMHGVFDSERSSDEEHQPKSRQKKKKLKRKKSTKSLSSQTSHATNDSLTSHSHKQSRDGQDKKHRERKRISSNHSESSKHSKSSKTSKGSPGRTRSVPPPKEEVIAWAFGMSQEKQRRAIAVGMRVKVRFMKPKMKWYGGVVTARSAGGKRIRIKYDDGTKEEPSFPDKEIVVDDEGNGRHSVSVYDFLPTEPRVPLSVSSRIQIERPVEDNIDRRSNNNEIDSQADNEKVLDIVGETKDQEEEISNEISPKRISPTPSSRLNDRELSQQSKPIIEFNNDSNHSTTTSEVLMPTLNLSLSSQNVRSTATESRNEEKHISRKVNTACTMIGESSPKRPLPQIPAMTMNKKLKIRSRSSSPRNITVTAQPEKKSSTTLKIRINPKSVEVKKVESGNCLAKENKPNLRTPQDIEAEEVFGEGVECYNIENKKTSLERSSNEIKDIVKDQEFEKPKDEEKLEPEGDGKGGLDEMESKDTRSRSQSPSNKNHNQQRESPSVKLHEESVRESSTEITEMEVENSIQNQSKEKRKGLASPLRTELTNTTSKNGERTSQYDAQSIDERSSRRAAMKAKQRIGLKEDGTTPDDQKQLKKRRRDKSLPNESRRSKKTTGNVESGDKDVWVQCNRCEKWRLIPSDKNLPDKWYCELNATDPRRNHCDAAEQTQEEVARKKRKMARKIKSQSPLTINLSNKHKASTNKQKPLGAEEGDLASIGKGGKQIDKGSPERSGSHSGDEESDRKKSPRDAVSGMNSVENDDPGSDHATEKLKGSNRRGKRSRDEEKGGKRSGKGKKQKEVKDQEWVQCERCEKWRRLPLHISAKDLPEKWYCKLNHWDPRSASCAVQEDHSTVEQNEDKLLPISPGGQQVGSSNKLSYQSLIKKPARPISERVRAAESLFSSHAGEIDGENSGPPSVMYLNSSAFQQKFRVTDQEAENAGESRLFNYMNTTKLWSVLYQIASPDDQVSNSKAHQASTRPQVQKSTESDEYALKTMIYFVMGTGIFAADELLLACQLQNWNDDRFTALKASFTIESVVKLLNLLESNGLVERISIESEGVMNVTKYKRSFQLDSTQDSALAKVSKHSKPWKNPID